MVKELVQYRHLLFMLMWRDIRIKYKQSIMGFMWAIFMPVLIVAAGVLIKKVISVVSGNPLEMEDIISVSVKSLPWAFFISSIKFATGSLVGNSNLVTKIYFPRAVLPIAAVLSNLVDFFIASIALAVLLTIAGIGISVHILWLPLLLLVLILFTISLGLILSCGNLFFRDVKYIVEVLVTFAIFFTPVFYDASMFGNWESALLLNPVGAILENINAVVVLHKPPDFFWFGYSAIWAIGSLLIFSSIFHKAEFAFAENI
ncbi:MAG: ABC transporter permease [Verrucomicrobiales bacterium]